MFLSYDFIRMRSRRAWADKGKGAVSRCVRWDSVSHKGVREDRANERTDGWMNERVFGKLSIPNINKLSIKLREESRAYNTPKEISHKSRYHAPQ